MIYAWLIDGGSQESIDKFDALLFDPPVDAVRGGDAPGWTDEETFESFTAGMTLLSGSASRLGATAP